MHDGGTVLNPEVFQGKTNIIPGNPVFNSRIPRRFGITHGSIQKIDNTILKPNVLLK